MYTSCNFVRASITAMCVLPLFLAVQQSARAIPLSVNLIAPTGDTCMIVGTVANSSATCSGTGNTAVLSGIATSNSLAASATITEGSGFGGIPAGSVEAYFDQPATLALGGCSNPPPGATNCNENVDLQLQWAVNGNYSYSGATLARIDLTNELTVNNVTVLDNTSLGFDYCDSGSPTCSAESGSGTISDTLLSTPIAVALGSQVLLFGEFDLSVQCGSVPVFDAVSCGGDFGDPILTNVLITDATTGLPVSGVTLTGADGTVYPVNVSSAVPEPSFAGLALLILMAIGVVSRRRSVLRVPQSPQCGASDRRLRQAGTLTALVLLLASGVHANPIGPGGSGPPDSFPNYGLTSTIIAQTGLLSFSFDGGLTTGNYQEYVATDTANPYCSGCLDFGFTFTVTDANNSIGEFQLSPFFGFQTDGGYDSSGVYSGTAPNGMDRGPSGGIVFFTFSAEVLPGENSALLLIETNATNYTGNGMAALGDNNGVFGALPGFAPTVPEPSATILAAFGILALAFRKAVRRA